MYICIPSEPSHSPILPSRSSPRALNWSPSDLQQVPTSYVLHTAVYLCQFQPLRSSHLLFPSTGVHTFILYICIFILALPIGSSAPFFQIPHICISRSYLFFFLTHFSKSQCPSCTPDEWNQNLWEREPGISIFLNFWVITMRPSPMYAKFLAQCLVCKQLIFFPQV